jgi:hypothetical protein
MQWVPGVKGMGCEADHSPASSAEVKNNETIPQLSHTFSLIKPRDKRLKVYVKLFI